MDGLETGFQADMTNLKTGTLSHARACSILICTMCRCSGSELPYGNSCVIQKMKQGNTRH